MIDTSVAQLELSARFECRAGLLTVTNPFLPGANPFTRQQGAKLVVEHDDGRITAQTAPLVSSWFCQANAFARIVHERNWDENPAWDAVRNMRVIDVIYGAAGMKVQQSVA